MSRQLKVLTDLESIMREESSDRAALPNKAQCLYVEPLPSGERKNCKNCALWVTDFRCLIHEPTIHIAADAICGYWVGGKPRDSDFRLAIETYIPPSLTGLTFALQGTSCDNCTWYESQEQEKGRCHGLQEGGKPASVRARACCARWEPTKRDRPSGGSR